MLLTMKKKLIITISSVLFIFLLVVLVKNAFSCKLQNSAMGVQSVVSYSDTHDGIDTLFIGSSAYRKGIDMSALSGNAFMLTYNGNEPYNILIELEEILSSGAKIDRAVIDFNPSMMDRGADLSDKRLLWDISFSGKIKLWEAIAKEESSDFFTFYDYWILSNNDYMVTYPISYKLISSRYYLGGGIPSEDSPGQSADVLDSLPVIENPGLNQLQLDSIDNIVKLLDSHDIECVFLEAPRYFSMANDINYLNKKKTLRKHMDDKGYKYLLAEDMEYDTTNAGFFADLTHMSGEGKREFTEKINEYLFSDN